MYSKLAVVAVVLAAVAGVFADDFSNNCNAQKRYCQNGGVCHEPAVSTSAGTNGAWVTPLCICPAGFGGLDCSRTIRECKDNPCQNGGTCHPGECQPISNYDGQSYECFTCECPHGWTGSPDLALTPNPNGLCDWKQTLQGCDVNSCANGGTCTTTAVSNGYGYSCACPVDYWGGDGTGPNRAFNCTVPRCSISGGACLNGGTCNNPTTNPTCACGFYSGDRCEIPRFCDSNPCPAGYTCTNGALSTGTCSAPPFCSTHTCQNGATCHDSGSYCECATGFDGQYCNSTVFCNTHTCQNGGTCQNTASDVGGQGTCTCPKGWVGELCEKQLNGCGRDTVGCAPAATSGCRCRDKASCASSNYNTKCSCPATTGGLQYFDCRCNSTSVSKCPGTSGTVTGRNSDMVCQNGGTCLEVAEEAQCSCRQGFWGDQCQNYDNPCLNNPCENGGACYITAETQGLPLDDRYWAWRCKCKWPFYGKNCEKQAPVSTMDGLAPVVCGADNSPCQNGGTCSARIYDPNQGGFFWNDQVTGLTHEAEPWICTCPVTTEQQYGYQGEMCESLIEQCTATTCQNGGFCFNNGNGPRCNCPCGYAGDRCEIAAGNANAESVAQFSGNGAGGVGYRLEFCSQEPCQNGGTCFHTVNGQGFTCRCKSGWAGTYCQWSVRSAAAGVVPSIVAVAAALAVAFALKH